MSLNEYYGAAGDILARWPITDESQKHVTEYLDVLVNTPPHLFFTPTGIQSLLETFMIDPLLQEAVLSTTTHLSIYLESLRPDPESKYDHGRVALINTIAGGVSRAFIADPELFGDAIISVLPDQIQMNVALKEEDVIQMLHANFWIVTLWMLRFGQELYIAEVKKS